MPPPQDLPVPPPPETDVHNLLFEPGVWGPSLWKFLHIMAASYPDQPSLQSQTACRQFLYALRFLLPCDICCAHYGAALTERAPATESAVALQQWVVWLHNRVRAQTHPGEAAWSLEQVQASLLSSVTSLATAVGSTAPILSPSLVSSVVQPSRGGGTKQQQVRLPRRASLVQALASEKRPYRLPRRPLVTPATATPASTATARTRNAAPPSTTTTTTTTAPPENCPNPAKKNCGCKKKK